MELTREVLEVWANADEMGCAHCGGPADELSQLAALALSLMDERDAARDILIGSADVICANCLNFETGQRVSCDPTCPVFIAISLDGRYSWDAAAPEPKPEGGQ